jgi:hypothetical protein
MAVVEPQKSIKSVRHLSNLIRYSGKSEKITILDDMHLQSLATYRSGSPLSSAQLMSFIGGCTQDNILHDFENAKLIHRSTNGPIAYHYIQSFKPGEVSPIKAHEVGVEFVNKIAPGYQVAIYTHIDKDHIHNHIVINSVNLETGYRYNKCDATLHHMRKISDEICLNHMASVSTPAVRLDLHTGMMKQNSQNLMAFQNSNLTGQLNHYIIAGDWYDLTQNCSNGNVQLHYPITVQNGRGTTTETHYFNGNDFRANSDGAAGTFTVGFNQSKWYNKIPLNGITYQDNWSDNGAQIYVSNNIEFHTTDRDNNNNCQLWCGNQQVMWPSSTPKAYCYYNHLDTKDADWGWNRKQQQWGVNGLKQGSNTVYYAGTDASANYTTGSATFLYDSIKPYDKRVSIENLTSSGYDFKISGAGDATSGVDKLVVYYWTKSGEKKSSTATHNGDKNIDMDFTLNITDGGGQNYRTDLYIYDKAGNYFLDSTSPVDSTPPSDPDDDGLPLANFTVGSPVSPGFPLGIQDLSQPSSDDYHIDREEWSWSTDDGRTWTDPTSQPPTTFNEIRLYKIKLRVHESPNVSSQAKGLKAKWSNWITV